MKSILLFFIITCTALTIQAQTIEGTYANKWESPSGEAIAYDLTLHEDGTFIFILTRTFLASNPDTTNQTEGTWKIENHLLVLTTTDETSKLASDLNLNKARYVNKSSRHPNFNLIKPSLKFYESDVFYAKNMELIKIETSVTSVRE